MKSAFGLFSSPVRHVLLQPGSSLENRLLKGGIIGVDFICSGRFLDVVRLFELNEIFFCSTCHLKKEEPKVKQ